MKLIEAKRNPRLDYFSRRKARVGNKESGQVIIIVTLMLPVLLGIVGLVIDVGYLYQVKCSMQTATDAGALAAVHEILSSSSEEVIRQAVLKDIALNGFDGSGGEVIAINRPPLSGSYQGNQNYIEIVIDKQVPTFIISIFNITSTNIRTRAVSGGVDPTTLLVLDPNDAKALTVSGGAQLECPGGIMVNSRASNAIWSGSCKVTASWIHVTGGYSGTNLSPTPVKGVSPLGDPYSSVQSPTFSNCDHNDLPDITGSRTLYPGVYCGGITAKGSTARVHLEPGTYILSGGGLDVKTGGVIDGQNVCIYNTYDIRNGNNPGIISFSAGSSAVLSAPSSGGLSGIVFFGDRTTPQDTQVSISGGSNTKLNGVLYFPTQKVNYSGGSSDEGNYCTSIVARLITFSAGTSLGKENCGPTSAGQSLVE